MFRHGPSCLTGPISRDRTWWLPPVTPDCRSSADADGEAGAEVFRADLVARLRREIAAGTYDTPEKWNAALDRLLRRLDEE